MKLLNWISSAFSLLVIFYGGALAIGTWRWTAATKVLLDRLDEAAVCEATTNYDADELAGLPSPVVRYFKLALTDGQPIIRTVDLEMEGVFNLTPDAPRWKRFTSTQHVVAKRPGFVWNACIRLFPGAWVRVHDAYIAGEGILRPSLFGVFSLGAVQGAGPVASGELMRWLAETVWYPTALLPSQGVTWQAVDATSAQVTLVDGPITIIMLFRFSEDGLVSGISVESRGAMVEGQTVMMPWMGSFSDYRHQNGMMIPFRGEVAWITPEGARPYFDGTVRRVEYGFA